ncbi:thioredoxin family protein [Mesoaciditoga lauensis]|uniref:thioredoxin family protein n=1 Tax=Mesoaciditoga lauensis TaxID=1495039 RepID=UPI001477173E|nr:thioredoxin fold domain-containing protein [Mesoaciditoga lauensis]
MKKKAVVLFLIVSSMIFSYAFSYPLDKFLLKSFNTVMNLAKYEQKDAIVIFSDPGCFYCKKLKDETLTDKTVQEILVNNFIVGEVYPTDEKANFEGKTYSYRELFAGFGIKGTPTIVFFTPDGKPITYVPGYVDAKNFSTILRYIATKQYLKKVDFREYSKKKNTYLGTPTILEISKEVATYISSNDPLSTSTIAQNGDKFLKYIIEGKDAMQKAKEMEKEGFYNIFVVKEK